jgi:hypothetical protein
MVLNAIFSSHATLEQLSNTATKNLGEIYEKSKALDERYI